MNHRHIVAAVALVTVALLVPQGAAAQDVPRTAWGQPDLQGVWDFATMTPLERPAEYAGQTTLSEKMRPTWSHSPTSAGRAFPRGSAMIRPARTTSSGSMPAPA